MIWKSEIYEYCKINHPNGIKGFLRGVGVKLEGNAYFDMLVEYLLYKDGWLDKHDFKIKKLDTNREM